MPGFEIVTEESRGYDEHGHRTSSVRGFIKLDESVEPLLKKLRGAPLSFFICVSAHEPSVCKNGKAPYTRSDVERITGFSERAVQYAAQMLVSLNFVVVCGTTESGEKMYRPSGEYAWFGDRGAKIAPLGESAKGAKTAPIGVQKTTRRGAKSDASRRDSRSRGVQKTTHDDDVYTNPERLENKHHHNMARVREILIGGGFRGKRLDEIAGLVTEEEACVCVEWIARAQKAPDQYRSPFGYVYALAKAHSIATLPAIKKQHRLIDDEFAKYVHGRPEHTQYCREHPDEVDCECGTLTFEGE